KGTGRNGERRERGHGHGDRNRPRRGERRPETGDVKLDDAQPAVARTRRQPVAQDSSQAIETPRVAGAAVATAAVGEAADTGSSNRGGRNRRGRGRNRRDETQNEN